MQILDSVAQASEISSETSMAMSAATQAVDNLAKQAQALANLVNELKNSAGSKQK